MIDKKRIGIVILATNAYFVLGIRFIKKFMYYYNGNSNIKFYFFSNEDPTDYLSNEIDITFIKTNHSNWLTATNSKFKNIINIQNQLSNEVDYVYYFDADTNIINKFNEDWFMGDLVGLEHFGNNDWMKEIKSYDRNLQSKAYIPFDTKLFQMYYHGSLIGGKINNMINMCEILYNNQMEDMKIPYEPSVNDESYINQYYHYNPPTHTILNFNFEFMVSDKGGLNDMRNPDLDVSDIKTQMLKNKFKIFDLENGNLKIFEIKYEKQQKHLVCYDGKLI
jgi:hypothetical protein